MGKLGYDDLMGHGLFSLDEMRLRSYLIHAHLMQNNGRVCKSSLYESLDSTEKGAASYFIGMAVSKLIGAFLLNTPWLVHLEKSKALYDIDIPSKSRPDLLGLNSQGQWIVFEAKGRTQGFSQDALDKAKDQTSQIRHIAGVAPALRIATESFFDRYLSAYVADPEEFSNRTIDLEIDKTQFFISYYSTLRNLSEHATRMETVGNYRYAFIDNESAGISIGLIERVLDRLQLGEIGSDDFVDIPSNMRELSRKNERSTKYYPDGIAISLNDKRWAPEIMSLEPSKR